MKLTKYLALATLIAFFASCGGSGDTSTETESTEETTANEETATEETEMVSEEAAKDIVALAMETESLSTLVTAVKAGGLVETLQGEGPYTVFAPTNDAFAALPEGTLETLLKPENKDQLAAILKFHVVPGNVMSSDLSDGMTATTAQGSDVTINTMDGVTVNGAAVTMADIKASNGVVHVIDAVILPPEE